ncbi:Taf3p KNAG_0D02540 [Huiozyma naganishii CBS 8797]|uniref:Bromodomain associated domain-containing protein n=1 Tax=Huiozyma naganishii (strain ATCC MYA-139 / BCRC 22969 / CBS 8797 / KCTC 17520 / NBRC 10181 / NCYC 3082 / Yp74L-3) TaxID=1071383 RepID=J7RKJ2_HUIN7|nr:hypothetical protein KNAG_0D02540 [Kazachstania naganishii CBS 8797]CCK70003.1 hypothetical protein KNAG_0D02540 [Kazachstania naganishii CBS 8797]
MTASGEFHFGLLRVAVLQLLKAVGFDRAKPSTVDTVADLYVRFLELLVDEVRRLAQARCGGELDDIALQDVSLALANLHVVRGGDVLDVYGENPHALGQGPGPWEQFREWCGAESDGGIAADARVVAAPPIELLRSSTGADQTQTNTLKTAFTVGPNRALDTAAAAAATAQEDDNVRRENELVEELIQSGDTDDWLRLLVTRQKLAAWTRARARAGTTATTRTRNAQVELPEAAAQLPGINGWRHSVLAARVPSGAGHTIQASTQNEYVPADVDVPAHHVLALASKLPTMMQDSRLENVTLSYENDQNSDSDTERHSQMHNNTNSNENNLQFTEMEDMDNTFQRRQSIDFDQSYP